MSIYDRLMSDLGRMDEREFTKPSSNLLNRLASERTPIPPPAVFPTNTTTINLGGGLGTIPMPQINLEQINQALAGLDPTVFGFRPPAITPQVEPVETNLEDTGASQEVMEDVGDNTYDLGILDPSTGQVYEDEEDLPEGVVVGGGDGPAGTVIEQYTPPPPPSMISEAEQAIAPSATPTPTPVTDVVTGQEIPLNTPLVNVPQESLTGLGSYFTTPQINQIVNPGYTPQATTDMDKLLQLQRESFRNFLVQPQPQTEPQTEIRRGGGEGGSGIVGEAYQPFEDRGSRNLFNNQGIYNLPTGIQFPTNQMFGVPSPQLIARGPMDNYFNSGFGDAYGGLVFPDFSGITSLVPQEEIAKLSMGLL